MDLSNKSPCTSRASSQVKASVWGRWAIGREGTFNPEARPIRLLTTKLHIISRDTASKARQTLTLLGGNFPEVFKVQQDALTKLVKYCALQLGPGARFDIKSTRLAMERPVFIRVSYNPS